MSLFDIPPESHASDGKRPLADRLRPERLEDFVGQEHILGAGKPLRRQIETDTLGSVILWGPPGVGKTTLARLIARLTKCEFIPFSAVLSGIKEIKAVMADAEKFRRIGHRTIVFIDEIHRFNKAQQDAFLPYVERGDIILIGATTENPSFEVISALHKSVRSSDVDAALYWLARMLEAGEDRMYIARRLVRMAIEDISLADPRALEQSIAAMQAVHFLGIPEGDLALAQAAIYLAA